MKGYRFYEELEHKNRKAEQSKGSVVAVVGEHGLYGRGWHPSGFFSGPGIYCYEAFSGLYNEPNPPVCFSSVGHNYLREQCRRVSEQRAREIHPALFERLDD